MEKNKVLIIRFSSFGDIVQASTVVELIGNQLPSTNIHWVTRGEFRNLLSLNKSISKILTIEKNSGLRGLLKLAVLLRKENYTHVYDAHSNLRSAIIKIFLLTKFSRPKLITRSKERIKRLLLFFLRINLFPKPFRGIESYIKPLLKWNIYNELTKFPVQWSFPVDNLTISKELMSEKFITFVPSAAWKMKRWPVSHWKKLVLLLPNIRIVILGGPDDLFCEEISQIDPTRIKNYCGKLSLLQSCDVINKSAVVISGDTGLLHVADVLGIPGVSLMGPTAFGFTTSSNIITLETNLECRPCTKDGRGTCSQSVYQKCMLDISPEAVAFEILKIL